MTSSNSNHSPEQSRSEDSLQHIRSAIPSLQNRVLSEKAPEQNGEDIKTMLSDIKLLLQQQVEKEEKEQSDNQIKTTIDSPASSTAKTLQPQNVPDMLPFELNMQGGLPTFASRFLPPSERPETAKPVMRHTFPLAAGVFGAVLGVVLTFASPFALSLGIILGNAVSTAFSFLLAGYVVALSYHLLQQSSHVEKQKRLLDVEFAEPYSRFRVTSKSQDAEVILQLVEYKPQHQLGERPNYKPQVVKEESWDVHKEVEIFEGLAQIKEDAAEKETEARLGFEKVKQALELQDQVRLQLSA